MQSQLLIKKLRDIYAMNNEIIRAIGEEALTLRIEGARSSTIGGQLACVARARDAYSKAILSDAPFCWNPDFPYDDRYNLEALERHMCEVSMRVFDALEAIPDFSELQQDLLLDLLGHEFMHQGQLIRYIYANRLNMATTTKAFWHLED